MHKGEEAELTLLKRDYPNEYDVAEERLTDKLPDELQMKVKLGQKFPRTRDDCKRFKIMISLWGRNNNWKIAVTFNPIGILYRQRMPSLVITLSNICKAVGAGLPGGRRLFKPDDKNTPFAGGHGPMTELESTYVPSGRLPFKWCQWVRRINPFPDLTNDWLVDRCEDTKAAVIKAMEEYNKRTKNKVRLV